MGVTILKLFLIPAHWREKRSFSFFKSHLLSKILIFEKNTFAQHFIYIKSLIWLHTHPLLKISTNPNRLVTYLLTVLYFIILGLSFYLGKYWVNDVYWGPKVSEICLKKFVTVEGSYSSLSYSVIRRMLWNFKFCFDIWE